MNTCPHCASSKLNGGFECGSMRVGEDVVQTHFCSYVTDFKKPLDAELQAAKFRMARLDELGQRLNVLLCCEAGFADNEEWANSMREDPHD